MDLTLEEALSQQCQMSRGQRDWARESLASTVWLHLRDSARQGRPMPRLNPMAAKLLLTELVPQTASKH